MIPTAAISSAASDAEPDRERPVGRGERDELLLERDRDDGVEQQRAAVHDDEDAGEQREETVHLLDREPRPRELARAPAISAPSTTDDESSR